MSHKCTLRAVFKGGGDFPPLVSFSPPLASVGCSTSHKLPPPLFCPYPKFAPPPLEKFLHTALTLSYLKPRQGICTGRDVFRGAGEGSTCTPPTPTYVSCPLGSDTNSRILILPPPPNSIYYYFARNPRCATEGSLVGVVPALSFPLLVWSGFYWESGYMYVYCIAKLFLCPSTFFFLGKEVSEFPVWHAPSVCGGSSPDHQEPNTPLIKVSSLAHK